jgi:hypothetical protein
LEIFPEADCNRVERRTFRKECNICCNDDGRCEPMQGETPENCPDCLPTPMPWEKELKVEWIRIDEDKHPFDEAWIQGKYEIIWDFVIANLGGGIIQNNRSITDPLADPTNKFDLFNKWKRKELPINRRS